MENIYSVSDDPFYRYKMPHVTTKIQKSKTVIVNLDEISKSLNRQSTHLLRHLSHSLCTQSSFDKKNMTYKLNGHHEEATIQRVIFEFVRRFILCSTCNNPETEFVIDCRLYMQCKACGNKNIIRGADKLIKFIINNSRHDSDRSRAPESKRM